MTAFTKSDVREFLIEFLGGKLKEQGRQLPEEVTDDCDLLLSGYLDSLGFLELMTAIQDRFISEQLANQI
jgi:acyl carrier protein